MTFLNFGKKKDKKKLKLQQQLIERGSFDSDDVSMHDALDNSLDASSASSSTSSSTSSTPPAPSGWHRANV